MTCASCAARIEKKLNRMDGVTATVNYATEKAKVSYPEASRSPTSSPPSRRPATRPRSRPPPAPAAAGEAGRAGRTGGATPSSPPCAQRLIVSAVLAVPVVLLAMVPALQFDNWQWLSLTLAAPVVVWGALPFHRAAWTNARHGAATMDTLVSVGTLAAFGWSLWALFFGHAGMPGMRHGFDLTISRTDGSSAIYLEVAAGVTAFILAGPLPGGALQAEGGRGPAGADGAGRQGRRRAAGRQGGTRPGRAVWPSVTASSYAPERRSPPTARSSRAPPPSTPRC